MRTLLILAVGSLAVGCATVKDIGVHLGGGKPSRTKAENQRLVIDGVWLTPEEQKQKTLRDSVAGTYERNINEINTRIVFLENSNIEVYRNGNKYVPRGKWKVPKEGEILVTDPDGDIGVWRINKDRSLTVIALIGKDGGRVGFPKEEQETYKKIN